MTVDTEERLVTVRRILHAADHDIPAFLEFFTEATEFRMANADPVIGRDAILEWIGGYMHAVASTHHEIVHLWESDDAVAVRMDVTYRMQSGVAFTLPAVTEFRLRDGRLTHYLIYMDPSPVTAEG